MNRCCFLSIIMISLLLFSCATNGEDAVNEGVIAEKTAPVIIIVEETSQAEERNLPEAEIPEQITEEPPVSFEILNAEARQQSAILTISYPDSADLSLLSIAGGGYISEIKASKNTATLIISGLESLSDYSLTLLYEGEIIAEPCNITTDSFAGKYRWTAADGSESEPFVLYAAETPVSSNCPIPIT